MRLLRLEPSDRTWRIEDFSGPTVPFYAILSHTWGSDDTEVKFEDIQDGSRSFDDTSKSGYDKLRFCHKQVEKNGLRYFWIDTCCIKKSDSSELERSLNSMFYWYQRAAICYVYLSDVSIDDATDMPGIFKWEKAFSKSRWFRRGWTLQELIAPSSVIFFSKEGRFVGDKNGLAMAIAMVTQIPTPALRGVKLSRFSTEERLCWAAGRQTSVPEDSAYCLIGIFDVQLHMLYADGEYDKRKRAALAELNRAIERSLVAANNTEDVIRVGGASWSDLSRLGQRRLRKLDADLDGYLKWLLSYPQQYDKDLKTFFKLSKAAGDRMRELLKNAGVSYEDLSGLEPFEDPSRAPWTLYNDKKASDQARVQALIKARWNMTSGSKDDADDDVFAGITAVRTLEDLMVWRGKWKK